MRTLLTLQQNRLFHSLFSSLDESKDITSLLPKPDESTTLQRIDLVSANVRGPLFLLQYTRNRSRDSDNRSRESIMILVRIHEDLTVENLGSGKFYRERLHLVQLLIHYHMMPVTYFDRQELQDFQKVAPHPTGISARSSRWKKVSLRLNRFARPSESRTFSGTMRAPQHCGLIKSIKNLDFLIIHWNHSRKQNS